MKLTTLLGSVLGLVGAGIDFISGYLILANSMVTTNNMGVSMTAFSPGAVAWGIGLVSLGVVLVLSALALVSSIGMNRMGPFGALMIVYGVVMLFIGSAMYAGFGFMMNGSVVSGLAMLVVGTLMIINGVFMRRPKM